MRTNLSKASLRRWFLLLALGMLLGSFYSVAERGIGGALRVKTADGQEMELYRESHALAIGISKYTNGFRNLPGVKQDIEAVQKVLEKHGFHVVVVENPGAHELDEAIRVFIDMYGQAPENRLLIYFCGHGHTEKLAYGEEMGYIVPADAAPPQVDKDSFFSKAMTMEMVEIYAKRIQSKHALFLFDSCFSGSIFGATRAVPEIISYKTALPVRQFITSGSANETVPDSSLFCKQFILALDGGADADKDSYVTGTELGEFLQVTVTNYSKGYQHPQYGKIRNRHLDKGDFVFSTRAGTTQDEDAQAAAEDREQEAREREHLIAQAHDTYGALAQREEEPAVSDIEVKRRLKEWDEYINKYGATNYQLAKAREKRDQYKMWRPSTPTEPGPVTKPEVPVVPPKPPVPPVALAKLDGDCVLDLGNGVRLEMLWIPGGAFTMGSSDGDAFEKPAHAVELAGFWLGKYEVTKGQWEAVMGAPPWRGKDYVLEDPESPAVHVSWADAQAFVSKLNARWTGGFCLPTEAQWEYACRAGSTAAYCFGDDVTQLPDYAYLHDSKDPEASMRYAQVVGLKKANDWGLYDMHGNVWEWCADWYDETYYSKSPRTGPPGPRTGSARVLRGGSWNGIPWYCRSSYRFGSYDPASRVPGVGFRICRVSPEN